MINFPTIEELSKRQQVDDPEFRAWVETVPDKHWARLDLSAVRIGYELGKSVEGKSQERRI